ncbi:site-specific integrase [Clostridium sp. NSJ-6]|uniref:Site-specific integrase n=1 Tax=Clostridium hominis TaxID=2763036 RepID=A0ABR7DEJ4_9CLOT|nr:site-specific integrase [Clostridium hominis]MBC5629836.1 site-specific integrase [Clostridium hominis]
MQGGVRKKGDTWYYYFDLAKVDGKRKKIERKGGSTKKEALTALRNAIAEYENAGTLKNDNDISYSDYLDYWMNNYVKIQCKRTTEALYKRYIEQHIKPILGLYKLKTLNPSILQDFLNKKSINGFSKNTVSSFYGLLSGSLKYAVYPMKYIKENPMTYVHMPRYDILHKKDSTELKIISLTDFNKMIERFPVGSSFYIPLQIAFQTGLRASEVTGLTWDDIDFNNYTLEVNKILVKIGPEWTFGTPKTQSSHRIINIGPSLVKILQDHKIYQDEMRIKYGHWYRESNFICTKENGENITTESLKYLSRVVNYELKINFNFHSLRHTHATMLIENGANMKDVQNRLGHSKLSTTMDTYAHVTPNMQRQTVDIFENAINNPTKG